MAAVSQITEAWPEGNELPPEKSRGSRDSAGRRRCTHFSIGWRIGPTIEFDSRITPGTVRRSGTSSAQPTSDAPEYHQWVLAMRPSGSKKSPALIPPWKTGSSCLLYTSDAADERS